MDFSIVALMVRLLSINTTFTGRFRLHTQPNTAPYIDPSVGRIHRILAFPTSTYMLRKKLYLRHSNILRVTQ